MFEIEYKDIDNFNLQEKLLDHGLIVIRNASLQIEDFENITSNLGKALVTTKHVLNESRTIQELSNTGLFGTGDVNWHHDWSYGRGNYFGTILYNVRNAHLSPTWFCDMSKAPDILKYMYKDAFGEYYPPQHLHGDCFTAQQLRILEKQKVTRPYVIKHHVTNEEILYCSIGTLQNFDWNITPIREWIEENAIKHEWEDNDILIWDNLKMNHKRVAFEGERLLWRTQFII